MTPLATSPKGEFRQIAFSPPLALQVGDQLTQDGNVVSVIRGGVVVDQRALASPSTLYAAPAVDTAQVVSGIVFFRSNPVAGQNVSLVGVQLNNTSGAVTFKFSDGENVEYDDIETAKSAVQYLDTTGQVCRDSLVLKTFRNSPDGTNLENMVGGAMTANFDADVPFVLTNPDN